MSNIKQFETENRGIITQLIFDKEASLPMLKLVVLLSSTRKDKITGKYYKNKYFNLRNIAEMIDCPVSTTITAMQKLIKKNIVVHKDQYYFLNQGIEIEVDPKMDQIENLDQDLDQADQKMDQVDQDSDQTRSENGSYNNKKYNNLKNNKKDNIQESNLSPIEPLNTQTIVTHRPEAKDSTEVAICQDFDDSVVPEAIKNMKKESNMMVLIQKAKIFKDGKGFDYLVLPDGRFNTVNNKNVFLSHDDRNNLQVFYKNLELGDYIGYAINYLNSYLAENPKKFKEYKNHYLVLTRWVKEKAQDQKIKDNNEERSNNYLDKSKLK